MSHDNQYFRKIGRRYVPVYEFPFEPAPGIWIVGDGSQRMFMRLGDTPTVMVAAAFAKHHEVIASAIHDAVSGGVSWSPSSIADAVVRAVAKAEDPTDSQRAPEPTTKGSQRSSYGRRPLR